MSEIKNKGSGLHSTRKWLLIADVFKGQWTDKVKILIEKQHSKIVPDYTRKVRDSVRGSYLHWQGYRKKWMARIWDNQSD